MEVQLLNPKFKSYSSWEWTWFRLLLHRKVLHNS